MQVSRISTGVSAPNDGAMRTRIFRHLISGLPKGKLVDLGAGPCLFAKYARDAGFQVVAVDARTARLPPAEELGSIKFVQADVRDFPVDGFDVIAMLGLVYHLDLEDQLSILSRCQKSGATVILDSQVHVPELLVPQGPGNDWEMRLVERDGFTGLEFPEGDNPMASIGNSVSFWHTDESWLKLFEQCGFSSTAVVEPLFQSKYGGRRFWQLQP